MLGVRIHQEVQIDLHQGDLASFVSDAFVIPAFTGFSSIGSSTSEVEPEIIIDRLQRDDAAPYGQLVVTAAGNLPGSCAVHVSMPPWTKESKQDVLGQKYLYWDCLQKIGQLGLRHISFAPLRANNDTRPLSLCAELALQSVREYLDAQQSGSVKRITFVLPGTDEYQAYRQAMFTYFPEADQE